MKDSPDLDKYIGRKYSNDYTCFHLFRDVEKEFFNTEVDLVGLSKRDLLNIYNNPLLIGWHNVEEPIDGDCVLFAMPLHIGVFINNGILHNVNGNGVVWNAYNLIFKTTNPTLRFYRCDT